MAKRILVIDDDKDILEILHIVFQDDGFDVVVSDTSEAADHIQAIHPDVVLLDIRIAGSAKTGVQICSELKANYLHHKLPIILVSAESDISILANECGADAFISKPFDIYQLLSKVKEFIH